MFLEPVTLSGEHVRLEPLHVDHAALLVEAANESRATYGLTIVPANVDEMRAYVEKALADHAAGLALPFAVRDRTNTLVGSTRFLSIEDWRTPRDAHLVSVGPSVVEIGFTWYAARVQRTALNTEAKLLLSTHAFETWRAYRIAWKTDARNARSRAAILRLGATFDGCIRAHRLGADGEIRDTAFFSMLASEWPHAKAELERRLGRAAREERPVATPLGAFSDQAPKS